MYDKIQWTDTAARGMAAPRSAIASEEEPAVITELKTVSENIDTLEDCGYPLRFLTRLDESIHESVCNHEKGALLLIMVDNLSMIVSGYGHALSEKIMKQVSKEVTEIVGQDDVVMRVQRDQLAVIIRNIEEEECQYLCERITARVKHHGCYSEFGTVHIMPSIGCIRFPEQASTIFEVIDHAYMTLYDTESQVIRSPEHTEDNAANNRQEMTVAAYISESIAEKRLKLAYQPIIASETGEIAHYEALLRLHGDDGKISSAGALIPVAERMGLIDVIDELTLHMVVEELRKHDTVRLALNVSNMTTRNDRWLLALSKLAEETPDIMTRLIVEITETAAQLDMRRTAYFVATIQSMGAQVALDDFGSGYTSFRQLKSLSVDMVKIDGAFIRDLVDNADNRFFVKTLLDFTNGFGLKAVAEFVETGEIAKMLMELGVEYMQGYYFGKPENVRGWINDGEFAK